MSLFQCPVCYKSLSTKARLIYHIKNNVCQKSTRKGFVCPKCHKCFTTNQTLQYHLSHKVCNGKIELNDEMTTTTSPTTMTTSVSQPNDILKTKPKMVLKVNKEQQLLHKIELLETELRTLKEHPQTVHNGDNITVVVPPEFLSLDTFERLMAIPGLLHTAIDKHPSDCVRYLIQETNCNPARPLYNSVKMPNKKEGRLQVSDGHRYIYHTKQRIIDELIENKRHILQKYIDETGDAHSKRILDRYQKYVDELDDEGETLRLLQEEVICMLLNVSEVIGSDEWSRRLLDDLKSSHP